MRCYVSEPRVDVFANGAVTLGEHVVCDGYLPKRAYRVQTHIHEDHMTDFNTSKGEQHFLLSPETYDLLIAERNADLPYRDNFQPVEAGGTQVLSDGSIVELVPSNHILGACQASVTLPSGDRLGYSGDFGWPIGRVIEVDELVVDSTYGSPRSVREYSQEEAEARLWEIVCGKLREGSVHIRAHRGTIERVLHLLGQGTGVPILASARLIRDAEVYRKHGYTICDLVPIGSTPSQEALRCRAYVRVYSKGDGFPNGLTDGTTVVCSAYMCERDNPVMQYSDRSFRVALSNHADFEGTLEYVRATGAKRVVTDNTRNGGYELALALNERIAGVEARPSSNRRSPGRS